MTQSLYRVETVPDRSIQNPLYIFFITLTKTQSI